MSVPGVLSDHEHSWLPWHWFITTSGWTRCCVGCGTWEPTCDEGPLTERPAEGRVCGVCEKGKPCMGKRVVPELACSRDGCKRTGREDLMGLCHVCWNNAEKKP